MKKGLAKYNSTGSLCWRRLAVAGLFTALLTLSLVACGGGGGGGTSTTAISPPEEVVSPPAEVTVYGVAATGAPMSGQVYLKDRFGIGHGPVDIDDSEGSEGYFSIDVTGFNNPPFYLKACDAQNNNCLYSVAMGPGIANINPLTNLAVAAAAGVNDPAAVYNNLLPIDSLNQAIADIQYMLDLLLAAYNANQNFLTDPFTADGTGLDKVFDDVDMQFDTVSGIVIFALNGIELGLVDIDSFTIFDAVTKDNVTAAITPQIISASGYGRNNLNAYLLLNVDSSSLTNSTLTYYDPLKRLDFDSTSIIGVSAADETATIIGLGTVNGVGGYTFIATVTDGGSGEAMGIVILKPDGNTHYSASSQAIIDGDYTVTVNGG